MKIDELFEKSAPQSIVDEILEEGLVETMEEAVLMESRLASAIKSHAARYNSRRPPEITALQNPMNRNHVVVLAAGDNMFFRFDVMSGRVVSEERFTSFREMMEEQEVLLMERYYVIDHRSWLKRNWKKIALSVLGGGAAVTVGAPLIMAILAGITAALTWMTGLAATGGAIVGAGWLARKIADNEG